MAELNDIFADDKHNLSDEELLRYLDGKIPEEQKHAVEKKMMNTSFEEEAMEGLQNFKYPSNLNDYVHQLNTKLHQQLNQPKQRKSKRTIQELPLAVITVIIILLLCVLAYVVVMLFQRGS